MYKKSLCNWVLFSSSSAASLKQISENRTPPGDLLLLRPKILECRSVQIVCWTYLCGDILKSTRFICANKNLLPTDYLLTSGFGNKLNLFNSFKTEPLSYRNQSIDLHNKSMDWFLFDRDLRLERVIRAMTEWQLWADVALCYHNYRLMFLSSRHLLVRIQQWKYQNNVLYLSKVSNKDMRTMSLKSIGIYVNLYLSGQQFFESSKHNRLFLQVFSFYNCLNFM